MIRFAARVVVLDSEQAMPHRTFAGARIFVRVAAMRTGAPTAPSWPLSVQFGIAAMALARCGPVIDLVEISARRTNQQVHRVAGVLGDQIAGEKINFLPARSAVHHLNPKKILHGYVGIAVVGAIRQVELLNVAP